MAEFYREVTELPNPLEPNMIYCVRIRGGFEFYVVDETGNNYRKVSLPIIVAGLLKEDDLTELINDDPEKVPKLKLLKEINNNLNLLSQDYDGNKKFFIPTYETSPIAKISDLIYVKNHRCFKVWQDLSGWSGYTTMRLGEIVHGTTVQPRPDEIDLMGGTLSKSEYPEIWAYAITNGLVVESSAWTTGTLAYADLGSNFKVPDLRDMFLRFTGTNADNANVRKLGTKQGDAIRNIVGYVDGFFNFSNASGVFSVGNRNTGTHATADSYSGNHIFSFDASKVVPTGGDNRPSNTAVVPRQKR